MKLDRQQMISNIANWNVHHLDVDTLKDIAKMVEKDELSKLSDKVLEALHERKIGK